MAVLTRADISRFFALLVRRLPCPVKLVITGGIEAIDLGLYLCEKLVGPEAKEKIRKQLDYQHVATP